MSLVGRVGRKRFRARMVLIIIYSLLGLGAVTTLYPFMLMASTGFKGPTDQNDNKLIPTYFQKVDGLDKGKPDDKALLGKYLADKYAGDASMITSTRTGPAASQENIQKYEAFLKQLPVDYWAAGFKIGPSQITSRLIKRYRDWLQQKYGTIDAVNRAYIDENVGFQTLIPPAELLEKPNWKQPNTLKYREWRQFKQTLPAEFRIPIRETRLFQEFLRSKFQNQFDQVPKELAGAATAFEQIQFPFSSKSRAVKDLLVEFTTKALPARYRMGAAEERWRGFLGLPPRISRWNVDDMPIASNADGPNKAAGESSGDLSVPPLRVPKGTASGVPHAVPLTPVVIPPRQATPPMPIEAYERNLVRARAPRIRSEFASRNFAYVFQYIALNGRALWNTAIFCLLAILTQLTVNPLAAYALSRYPIRASGKILIFLLATMAFPAEVAMIPGFLLLKQLHLLNTFAALVLPTAASGYMIFLLKGFFDSLPQELFEAGQIDGAKEITMMTKIALPLSRPVLGYLALLAFMGAYGAFLYAFLVVQDQKMWTLMVWIYQLQNTAPKAVIMAALTIAAIPTLLVFLLAQRTIMRGIVLPSER
ncbi:MAG: multiple sugar transport system permease protein [Fimbriimonadaceae bacterium]|jgi:multiple sugar transport system permease protein|nr:multiple sugar transport system permease protein [Fimbriimonadaceae bacterium]